MTRTDASGCGLPVGVRRHSECDRASWWIPRLMRSRSPTPPPALMMTVRHGFLRLLARTSLTLNRHPR